MTKTKYVAGVALLMSIGCSSDEDAADGPSVLMVGAFSRTGVSAVGTWELALELAAEDATEGLRQATALELQPINFIARADDTENKPDTLKEIAEQAVADGAKMIINGTSGDSTYLGKLAYDDTLENDLNMPIVCVACSSPGLHNPNSTNMSPEIQGANRNTEKWMFGLAMSSVPQSRVLWNILADNTPTGNAPGDLNGDGTVKISTIALNDAFGTGFQNGMETVAVAENPDAVYEKITHPSTADPNQYDWSSALEELTDNLTGTQEDVAPDVIIEFTFPQFSLALVKAYTGEIPFLHTHSMRERPVIVLAGGKLDGQEGTSYLPSDGASGAAFDARFSAVYNNAPRESQWDSHVYDGGILFALGTVKASLGMADPSEVTGAEIRDAMLTLNEPGGIKVGIGPEEFAKGVDAIANGDAINYEGASGPCDFDAYGRALNRIAHWRVNDASQAEDVAVYDCVADPMTCPKQE
jgi:hypothetical protein